MINEEKKEINITPEEANKIEERINKEKQEEDTYQNDVLRYINQKHENNIRKQYNPKIVNLYQNGTLVIDKNDYKLKDFFIVFNDKENNFHIKCINPNYKNEDIEYNKAIRFIDTTAFIKLIQDNNVVDNKIVIDNETTLNSIISNWDGYIHSEVLETDSVINKKMVIKNT